MDFNGALENLKASLGPIEEELQIETEAPAPTFAKQKLSVSIEKKGRGGKTATIISGFTLPDDEIAQIASTLKKKLSTGGSSRGGEILIQGDRRQQVLQILKQLSIV